MFVLKGKKKLKISKCKRIQLLPLGRSDGLSLVHFARSANLQPSMNAPKSARTALSPWRDVARLGP